MTAKWIEASVRCASERGLVRADKIIAITPTGGLVLEGASDASFFIKNLSDANEAKRFVENLSDVTEAELTVDDRSDTPQLFPASGGEAIWVDLDKDWGVPIINRQPIVGWRHSDDDVSPIIFGWNDRSWDFLFLGGAFYDDQRQRFSVTEFQCYLAELVLADARERGNVLPRGTMLPHHLASLKASRKTQAKPTTTPAKRSGARHR